MRFDSTRTWIFGAWIVFLGALVLDLACERPAAKTTITIGPDIAAPMSLERVEPKVPDPRVVAGRHYYRRSLLYVDLYEVLFVDGRVAIAKRLTCGFPVPAIPMPTRELRPAEEGAVSAWRDSCPRRDRLRKRDPREKDKTSA